MLENTLSQRVSQTPQTSRPMCNLSQLSREESDLGGSSSSEFARFTKAKKVTAANAHDSVTLTLANRVEKFRRLQVLDKGAKFIAMGALAHAQLIRTGLDKIFKT